MLLNSETAVLTERFTPVSKDDAAAQVASTIRRRGRSRGRCRSRSSAETTRLLRCACHEGNYAMRNTLSGSRADEKR
jgi:hypothetical protein